ncbi:mechanosensitive ion channel family protein [Agaribacter flavus]|uniref:Mechanosensitive ion channel family protein n=1 Tax=Agaribacter flavus TaxID=1902781 RepID=A0ABV7FNK4_9ALTE
MIKNISDQFVHNLDGLVSTLTTQTSLHQFLLILLCYISAYCLYVVLIKKYLVTSTKNIADDHPLAHLLPRLSQMIFPALAILFLYFSQAFVQSVKHDVWMLDIAITFAVLLFAYSLIREFVKHSIMATVFLWIGLPLLCLHLLGFLSTIIEVLESISISIGNINISLNGLLRVLFFGAILFWLGRASNALGKNIIRNHSNLDVSTREVFTKLFEVGLFCIIFVLLLNVMGINLTALAVFGGALGVGLGLGLQSIASNFISGIIILLDKSLTIGDFVELDNGSKGFVREFKMRHAVLETYDGKDILVPNEVFISSTLINWSHKDPKQRYRVDFSVSYNTDIRQMVEIIKDAVAEHPQVISGEDVPFEERPDCEIDSFGDNGINMFVEFWIEGIDDGKNRVGGDLLLTIFETLKAHDISIPFPQREIRILKK